MLSVIPSEVIGLENNAPVQAESLREHSVATFQANTIQHDPLLLFIAPVHI